MPNRVTSSHVKELTGTDLSDEAINVFIDAANSLVNQHLFGKGPTDYQLRRIELFLTGHLVTMNRERQVVSESVNPASVTYSDIFGKGLQATTYGQTALQLDPTGRLRKVDQKDIVLKAIEEKHEY
mgnify:CR=1 FL=1